MAPIDRLTDDLALEILSRVPAKSVCRFKCASKHWLGIVDDPCNRRKLAQSLAGFFCNCNSVSQQQHFPRTALHFVNASGSGGGLPFIYPSFAFLPGRRRLHLLDCCNGLVLCRLYAVSTTRDEDDEFRFRYVVCNPATEEWVALPEPEPELGRRSKASNKVGTARLGFDPAASPHFHVFVLLLDARRFIGAVEVYSSETGRWIRKGNRRDLTVRLADPPRSATVFLNGSLHLRTVSAQRYPYISVVDTKGETWSNFYAPCELYDGDPSLGLIQQSQGRLHYASFNSGDDPDEQQVYLEVYALEDYANQEWTLKHMVEVSDEDVFGGIFKGGLDWIAIHPESNLIFFTERSDNTLMCYSMDREEATEVCTLGEGQPPYLPYVPLYSRLESLRT